jgi:glutaredoxin
VTLTIYSKSGCHLCDEMKATVERVLADHERSSHRAGGAPDVTLEIVDISTDLALDAQYGLEIPVLTIDGKKVAKFRITPDDLTRRLTAR